MRKRIHIQETPVLVETSDLIERVARAILQAKYRGGYNGLSRDYNPVYWASAKPVERQWAVREAIAAISVDGTKVK